MKKYTFLEFLAAYDSEDFDKIEDKSLAQSKEYLKQFDFNNEHGGDCTNQSHPCSLCVLEKMLNEYHKYSFDEQSWRKENL